MITWANITALAILVAILLIFVIVYKNHKEECENNLKRQKTQHAVKDFKDFIRNHTLSQALSTNHINWYIDKYCRIEKYYGSELAHSFKYPDELLDKYLCKENFNEVEFFQECNEKIRQRNEELHKAELDEKIRTDTAINTGLYVSQCKKYCFDFNNISSFAKRESSPYEYVIIFKNITEPMMTRCPDALNLFIKYKQKKETI